MYLYNLQETWYFSKRKSATAVKPINAKMCTSLHLIFCNKSAQIHKFTWNYIQVCVVFWKKSSATKRNPGNLWKNFLWEKFVRKQHNILCNFHVIHVFTHFDICQDRHDAPDKYELWFANLSLKIETVLPVLTKNTCLCNL